MMYTRWKILKIIRIGDAKMRFELPHSGLLKGHVSGRTSYGQIAVVLRTERSATTVNLALICIGCNVAGIDLLDGGRNACLLPCCWVLASRLDR